MTYQIVAVYARGVERVIHEDKSMMEARRLAGSLWESRLSTGVTRVDIRDFCSTTHDGYGTVRRNSVAEIERVTS